MGSRVKFGQVEWREDKQRWRARYSQKGRRYERSFRTEAEADNWLQEEATRVLKRDWVPVEDRRRRFGDVAESWWGSRSVEPSTLARDRSVMNSLILEFFGDMDLEEVDYDATRRFVHALNRADPPYAPASVHKAHQLTRQVLRYAHRQGWISGLPHPADNLPKLRRKQLDVLSLEEMWAVAEAIDPRYRALVVFVGYTGCRIGEALGLRAVNLDLMHREVHIVEDLENVSGALRVGAPLKTEASMRTVPLAGVLVDELQRHLEQFGVGIDSLVFSGPTGAPINLNNWRKRHWQPTVEAVVGRYIVPSKLRHTQITLLVSMGASVTDLAAQTGNSPRVIHNTYAQQIAARKRVMADLLDQATVDLGRGGKRPQFDPTFRSEPGSMGPDR